MSVSRGFVYFTSSHSHKNQAQEVFLVLVLDYESKSLRDQVTCQTLHSFEVAEPGFEPGDVLPQSLCALRDSTHSQSAIYTLD